MKNRSILCKITSVILLVCILSSLVSCDNDREYDESEVLAATRELVKKSIPLNEFLYGKGLSYTEDGIGIYKRADVASLESFGVRTIDDIKSMVRAVYTKSYSESIFTSDVFSSIKVDDVVKSFTRYYQEYDKDNNPTNIMVNSKYEYFLKGKYEYHESMEIVDVEGEVITVRTLVTVTSENGKIKNINLDLKLIEEESGWRLSSPTYAVYNEYTDVYEDLKNK